MRLVLVLAAAIAATLAVSAKADDLGTADAIKMTKTAVAAQKVEAAKQVAELQRGPEHRHPGNDHRGPERRRGRWEHGRGPSHPWRPHHYAQYLGYTWNMEECRIYGRQAGFPFVTRYEYSGDCYGDYRPY